MAFIDPIINFMNDIFWGYVLIYGLLAVGLVIMRVDSFYQLIAVGAIGTLVAVLRLQGLWIPGVPGA